MCGRYVLSRPGDVLDETLQTLEGFELIDQKPLIDPSYNVAPTHVMPVVLPIKAQATEPVDLARVAVREARWDFTRAGQRVRTGKTLINARSETLTERPSFASSFKTSRCLVPATGFFEWRPDGNRQPFYFTLPEDDPSRSGFCFAGLWQNSSVESSEKGSAVPASFCIVTGKAGPAMAEIHHRRPVILEPQHYAEWLDPTASEGDLLAILRSSDPPLLRYPVSFRVNSVRHDDPGLLEEVREAPTNLSLF